MHQRWAILPQIRLSSLYRPHWIPDVERAAKEKCDVSLLEIIFLWTWRTRQTSPRQRSGLNEFTSVKERQMANLFGHVHILHSILSEHQKMLLWGRSCSTYHSESISKSTKFNHISGMAAVFKPHRNTIGWLHVELHEHREWRFSQNESAWGSISSRVWILDKI